MTREAWETLFKGQCGRCAVCGSTHPKRHKMGWATDHDHESGKVRGILCQKCNLLLGNAEDDPAILKSAISYLAAHQDT